MNAVPISHWLAFTQAKQHSSKVNSYVCVVSDVSSARQQYILLFLGGPEWQHAEGWLLGNCCDATEHIAATHRKTACQPPKTLICFWYQYPANGKKKKNHLT